MGKDPAFLFYPGDYLRDTNCLGEATQVAYDRIMCEHMRNIPITQDRLNFFTKRLTADQKSELMSVLTPQGGGFVIEWVVDSVIKRREYSESRRKNRSKSTTSDHTSHMKTYVSHMENENENENKELNKKGVDVFGEDPTSHTVTVTSKYIHDRPARIHGIDGFRSFLEANAITAVYSDSEISTFLEARNGAIFDDGAKHLINAINRHRNTKPGQARKLAFEL